MKRLFLAVGIFLSTGISLAQTPELINYQAVVRNASGASVTSVLVGVRVSVLTGSATGPEVYSETHTPTTNDYGLMNIKIGNGTPVSGDISTIDWGANTYFLKVEVDPTGGTAYSINSVSQLVSVPYALHAKTADVATSDADTDPANEYNTSAGLVGTNLELADGGGTLSVDLSSLIDDADADPANELISSATLAGTTLNIVDAGGTTSVDLSSLQDGVDDADADPANELITSASLVGTNLNITDAGGTTTVDLNALVNDADASTTNELNTSASLAGTTLSITDAGGAITVDLSSLVNDADADPANELITSANLVGTNLNITDAGGTTTVDLSSLQDGVDDADADAANELITSASVVGTDLVIVEGGATTTVDMSGLSSGGTRYYVGQQLFGGTIIWVDSTGLHGLVAANSDVGGAQFWDGFDGVSNETNFGGVNYDASDVTDGSVNTTNIVAHWGTSQTYAARTAQEYTGGGFTDWYLPSIYELRLMMMCTHIPQMGFTVNDFTKRYWSSTEPIADGSQAAAYRIDGSTSFFDSQISNGFVRPVRKF